MTVALAPELDVIQWFNTEAPLSLKDLRGRVVLIEAFQMLCPGCVSHGLPQAKRVAETFGGGDLAVIGLHSVFEHHAAQGTPEALRAFLHEYRITFPVGLDAPAEQRGAPKTMQSYQMQGTPTLLLIDRLGRLRKQTFGAVPDLVLGADIMALLKEEAPSQRAADSVGPAAQCDDAGCRVGRDTGSSV